VKGTFSLASSKRSSQAVRGAKSTLLWFGIVLIVLAGLNWASVAFQNGQLTPKLALDLEGGTQVVLAAKLQEGAAAPSGDQMNQAASIIRQRVDASGITEAEVTTQGGSNIVVSVPGEMDAETQNRIESSAMLEFRPVLYTDSASNTQVVKPEDFGMESFNATPTASPTDASDVVQLTDQLFADFLAFDCADVMNETEVADPDEPMVACDTTGTEKFVLGPVEISGEHIADASSSMVTNQQGVSTGQWGVNLQFDGTGTEQFRAVTERLVAIGATPDPTTGMPDQVRSRFAVTLDGNVIVAPTANAVITDGKAQIPAALPSRRRRTSPTS
jgi:preprotein translocase subunit SecD